MSRWFAAAFACWIAVPVCRSEPAVQPDAGKSTRKTDQAETEPHLPQAAPTTQAPPTTRQLIQTARQLQNDDPVAAAERFVLASNQDDAPENLVGPLRLRAAGLYLGADRLESATQTLATIGDSPAKSKLLWRIARRHRDDGRWTTAQSIYDELIHSGAAQSLPDPAGPAYEAAMMMCGRDAVTMDDCRRLLNWATQHAADPRSATARRTALSRLNDALDRIAAEDLSDEFGRCLSPETLRRDDPAVAVCARWAGRNRRWDLLVDAAERVGDLAATRTASAVRLDFVRLVAEAMVQTGRPRQSLVWWRRLSDHSPIDFAARLRIAELETAVGDDFQVAAAAITAARTSVDRGRADADHRYRLVDLIDAKLAIRRANFEDARYLLDQIVRRQMDGQNVDASSLAGQAQWLIGETLSMQGRPAEAIEAYRRVDGIDPGGGSSAAALLRAGECFEQLGRTRGAAVCYEHLLSRFADSPHAADAAARLAAVGSTTAGSRSSDRSIR